MHLLSFKKINSITILVTLLLVTIQVNAQLVPSDLMDNCNQWKITYPTGVEDKTLCGEQNNEFFYVNGTGDAIVFKAPIRNDNGTTPNSSYIRSELRERVPDGSVDIYWTTEGSHLVYVKQAITHLPINKSHLVATQIHGNKDDGIDDAMVLRLEDSHLFLSFNGGVLRSDLTIKTNYTLGTIHEVIFLVEDGKHYCYYSEDGNLLTAFNNNSASSYLVKDGANDYVMDLDYDDSYFKIGNYTQSNPDREGVDTDDPNNYGEVLVYDFSVNHGDVSVSSVTITPENVDLIVGNTKQLSASVIPATASNLGVSYNSSNSAIASVDSNGLVTAISEGNAVITVTTDDGSFTDTSLVNVIGIATGPNLALNKSITGTGTHDGDHEVANLVDGSTSTRWSVSGFPQAATIDLGSMYSVERTELVCYNDRDYQFAVSISDTENGIYTEIVDRSDNTTPGSASNPIVDTFTGVTGRFIKITTLGAETYTGTWSSLMEFRVFGDASLTVTDNNITETKLWPNPTTNSIKISNYKEFQNLSVYNSVGQLVLQQNINNESIDISKLNSGIYIFKLSGSNTTINKFIIKN
ncbi:polysaccharide lyase family 7 protein [Seonamhaeicola sp. MEBiC1930]|uniref:polysaccharide lyase family 7 protein n=1 Tax=Seonamhaeicola sp. MEBiC01930 TaxID=2976768 RepID=UPI003872B9FC